MFDWVLNKPLGNTRFQARKNMSFWYPTDKVLDQKIQEHDKIILIISEESLLWYYTYHNVRLT